MKPRIVKIGLCTLYLGNCRDIEGLLHGVDAVVSDPPYGIGYKVNERKPRRSSLADKGIPITKTEARAAIAGDDQNFNPEFCLSVKKTALFGAENYASRLPDGRKWIVWDKRDGKNSDSHSDFETVWLSVPGANRLHRQLWRGVCRAGEENASRSKKLHPNQKPVALIDRVFDELGIQFGQTVCDPYMGSGSTGVVAIRRGCRFIGCEIDPTHFETARKRLELEMSPIATDGDGK